MRLPKRLCEVDCTSLCNSNSILLLFAPLLVIWHLWSLWTRPHLTLCLCKPALASAPFEPRGWATMFGWANCPAANTLALDGQQLSLKILTAFLRMLFERDTAENSAPVEGMSRRSHFGTSPLTLCIVPREPAVFGLRFLTTLVQNFWETDSIHGEIQRPSVFPQLPEALQGKAPAASTESDDSPRWPVPILLASLPESGTRLGALGAVLVLDSVLLRFGWSVFTRVP